MSRTELWEAPKGSGVTGHVGFTVDDDDHVRVPYTMLTMLMQVAGLRRKLATPHEPRFSVQRTEAAAPAAAVEGDRRPPPGYRWQTPRECHGGDDYCEGCSPGAPERKVAPVDRR